MASKACAPRFAKGEQVFVHHKAHSWIIGEVQQVQANPKPLPLPASSVLLRKREHSAFWYHVACSDKLMGVSGEVLGFVEDWNLEIYDESIEARPVDDLLTLVHLHDAAILRTLTVRYFQNVIYTNIGVIVVAINPFNTSIARYQDAAMGAYLAERGQPISEKLLPHSWAQAHNTYHELTSTGLNQSILISGESGAGKTEAAKIVLKYLTQISAANGTAEEQQRAQRIATAIASCSPILEAFGNAKTVRNDNSSRFGKLLKLQFHQRTHLFSGAHTVNYLLEKSRVLTCGLHERVYHSFYLAAACSTAVSELEIQAPLASYKSLYAGRTLENKEYSTAEDFGEVTNAMRRISIGEDLIAGVWKIVSGILHLANVSFIPSDGEGSAVDPSTRDALSAACRMWGTSADVLQQELSSTELTVMGTTTRRLLPVHKAVDIRDALCKGVYSAVFEWLVGQCNRACNEGGVHSNDEGEPPAPRKGGGGALCIALLDIFGFESFEVNSFEQLCINYANETLQQHYNTFVFTKDMELCRSEGVDTVNITCPDLQPTLQLMQSIFSALDDQCALNGSEGVFMEEITKKHHKQHPSFVKDLTKKHTFGVVHFAGDVVYNVDGWIEKNRDTLKDVFRASLFPEADASQNALARSVFTQQPDGGSVASGGTKKARGPPTVACSFRGQMEALLHVIESTNPRWIRCVKPHPEKVPLKLSGPYTLRQLEFSGILGTVKIRKAGYPVRYPHLEFCLQFKCIRRIPCGAVSEITPDVAKAHATDILRVAELLQPRASLPGVLPAQVGKSLVFLKTDAFYELEQHRKGALQECAALLQRVGRGLAKRAKVHRIRYTVVLQRCGRRLLSNVGLHRLFAVVHAAKLAERRREREELERARRAEEKRQAADRERRRAAEAVLEAQRAAACQEKTQALIDEEERCRHIVESTAWLVQENAFAEPLLAQYELIVGLWRERALQLFLAASVAPLDATREAARQKIIYEEAEGFRWLMHVERQIFEKIWTREQLIATRKAEIRHRAELLEEFNDDVQFLLRVHQGAWTEEDYRQRRLRRLQNNNSDEGAPPPGRFLRWVDSVSPERHVSDKNRKIPQELISSSLQWDVDHCVPPGITAARTRTAPAPQGSLYPGIRVVHVSSGFAGTVELVMPKGLGDKAPQIVSVVSRGGSQTRWIDGSELAIVRTAETAVGDRRGELSYINQKTSPLGAAHADTRRSISPPVRYASAAPPLHHDTTPTSHFKAWRQRMVGDDIIEERCRTTTDLRAFDMWKQRAALLLEED